jgi:hypothetical protein
VSRQASRTAVARPGGASRCPASGGAAFAAGDWYVDPYWSADPFLSSVQNIPGTRAFWGVGAVYDPADEHVALIERIG